MIKIKNNIEGHTAKHVFIYKGKEVDKIKKELGREDSNLCLKVFYHQDKLGNWGDDPREGNPKKNTTIKEATLIQNICWYHGLAPRVYDLIKVKWTGVVKRGANGRVEVKAKDKICDAQVTDYIEGENQTGEGVMFNKVLELGKEYGWESNYPEYKQGDKINDKWLDFQPFTLIKNYKEKLTEKYREYGTYGKKYYHNVPELGLNSSPRKNESRIKWLGLDKIDFKGKDYVDLGCANGFFTRYADKKGAKRSCGIDTKTDAMKDPLLSAWIISNLTEQYNIQYREINIAKKNDYYGEPFDIATFLSMTHHVGVPKWLNKIAKVVIVEDNQRGHSDYGTTYIELKKLFSKVELKGHTEDRNNSHLKIYYCYR